MSELNRNPSAAAAETSTLFSEVPPGRRHVKRWGVHVDPAFDDWFRQHYHGEEKYVIASQAWDARQPEVDRLLSDKEAGLDLYRAIQGGFERCPMCDVPGLRHEPYCPVTAFMRTLGIGPSCRQELPNA